MKITMENKKQEFRNVNIGDVFCTGNDYCIKTGVGTAFDLSVNHAVSVPLDTIVEVVDCELIIK